MAITAEAVETAIQTVLSTGQSVSVEGVLYSRASLSALVSLRDQLLAEKAAATSARPTFRAFNLGGMAY